MSSGFGAAAWRTASSLTIIAMELRLADHVTEPVGRAGGESLAASAPPLPAANS